ncbi:MAG: hypothetical protein LUI08_02520 [Prevotella sp.]|nr:hypothetical protein [Prevotella sp.]
MNEEQTGNRPVRKRRRLERMSYAERGRFFRIRNILNLVFIVLAIAGMAVYFYSNRSIGGAMLIVAIVLKLVECVLRIIR